MAGSLTCARDRKSSDGAKLRSSFSRASISGETGSDMSRNISGSSVPTETFRPQSQQIQRRCGALDHRGLDAIRAGGRSFLKGALAQQVDKPGDAAGQVVNPVDRLGGEGHGCAAGHGEAMSNVFLALV